MPFFFSGIDIAMIYSTELKVLPSVVWNDSWTVAMYIIAYNSVSGKILLGSLKNAHKNN